MLQSNQNHDQNKNVKNTRTNAKVSQSGGKRVENKDNLDSREGEEQDDKGEYVTHNKKDVHSKKKH